MEILVFVLLGLFAGFFAGLLGIGGGVISVPVMALIILPLLDFPPAEIMHVAVASSLAAIIPTSIMSIYGHHRQQGITWVIAKQFTPGLLIGGIAGALLASGIDRYSLQTAFAVFLFFVATYMIVNPAVLQKKKPSKPISYPYISLPIGFISAVLGVGGGTMTVPYLVWRGVGLRKAIGVSAYCGLPIALSSTATYYYLQAAGPQSGISTFIYWPAVVGISLGSMIFAPIGAYFTHHLPVNKVKWLFSCALILAMAKLLNIF